MSVHNEYQKLTKEIIGLLTPRFHTMLYKNEYVELGKVIDASNVNDFVFGVYLFFTNKPHMFVMIKSPEESEYKYIEFSDALFEAESLLIHIKQMVEKDYGILDKREQYLLIEGIASSLKKALETFDSPKMEVIHEEVVDDISFQAVFADDKYFKLTSKSYLKSILGKDNHRTHPNYRPLPICQH